MQVWSRGTLCLEGGDLRTHDLLFDSGARLQTFGLFGMGGSVTVDGGQFRFNGLDTFRVDGSPASPVEFSFVNGADAEIRLDWGVGRDFHQHGATTVSGVSASGIRSTLISQLTTGELIVGGLGTGNMRVLDGALVEFGENVIVGNDAFRNDRGVGVLEVGGVAGGFRATVRPKRRDGLASISVGGSLGSTSGGDGTLRVFDGGLVETSGDLFIAFRASSNGSATVESQNGSPAEILVSDDLFVGGSAGVRGGTGDLRIAQGGLVHVGDVLKVWDFGSVVLDGGTVSANHLDLTEAATGSFSFLAGRLEVNQISGNLVNGGTLSAGNSIVAMTISGNYEQLVGAELEIEVAGSVPGTGHDAVNLTGTATLGGALHVITAPAFTPAAGQVFTILTSGERVGRFSELIITGPIRYNIVYAGNDVTLVADPCLGFEGTPDTDGDGVPDGCDACPGFDDSADSDGDGVPDGCDICAGFDDNADADGDGVPDGCDVCHGFDDNLDTNANGIPDDCELPCDIDLDGDVDLLDHAIFVSCTTGPVNMQPLSALCAIADLDLDNDIDLLDWVGCQTVFTVVLQGDPVTTTVTGRIQMPDGRPVSGADIQLANGSFSTVSAGDGRFFLLNVPADLSEISVTASVLLQGESFLGSTRVIGLVGGGITDIGTITLHRVVNWVSLADGLWSDGVNWDTGLPPGANQSAVIDIPNADITITHDIAVSFNGPFSDLLCNERLRLDGGTLSVAGTFQMNNTLELASGTIVDTTVDLGPSALMNVVRGLVPTLDGVTINGNMDMVSGSFVSANFRNGLTINGTVRLAALNNGPGSNMRFEGPGKFLDGHGTISFVSNSNGASIFQNDGGNLHIRSGVTIRGTGGFIGQSAAPLVQDGLIHSDLAGTITVRGADWINNGIARVSGIGSVLELGGTWTNHGTIEAVDGGRVVLNGGYQNLGTLTATDADVRLDGEFTIADLGTYNFVNSLVSIEGTLLNDAGLVIDADQFNWKLGNGTILGGTISSADGTTLELTSGTGGGRSTLDGVTLDAEVRMSGGLTRILIKNGITLNGTIRMSAGFGVLSAVVRVFTPNQMIDGTGRIEFLNEAGNAVIPDRLNGVGDLGVMTIGPNMTIVGAQGQVGQDGNVFPSSLVNQGTIHSDRKGCITIEGTNWLNNGLVQSSGGGDLFTFDSWTNNGILRIGPGPLFDSRADFTQSSAGTFAVGVRSTAPEGYGLMLVTGTATLDGILRVEFENTFVPTVGQEFAVLSYGDHIGEFAAIETVGLDPAFKLVPAYNATLLLLVIQLR